MTIKPNVVHTVTYTPQYPPEAKMPDLIGFEIATMTFVAGLVLGAIAWAWITSHVHVVIGAVTRAATPPAGDVAALDARFTGLGTQIAALEKSIGDKINAAITAAQPKT